MKVCETTEEKEETARAEGKGGDEPLELVGWNVKVLTNGWESNGGGGVGRTLWIFFRSAYLINAAETEGDRRTFTIIAPVQDAIRVTERRSERLGCSPSAGTALSSTTFSSAFVCWAIGWRRGEVDAEDRLEGEPVSFL